MQIGIDASRALKTKFKTGIEHYTAEIIKALAKIDSENQYLLYSPKPPTNTLAALPSNFIYKIMPFPRLWSQVRLSLEFLFNKPDVFFEPAHTVPLIHPKNSVITIHDLGFKYFPELYTPFEKRYHNFSADFSARHGKIVIVPSENTKNDLIKFYKLPAAKIRVVPHGIDHSLYYPVKQPLKDTSLDRAPYLFFIGRLEEKKNILGLLEAYALLRQEREIKHKLVLAGKPGFGYEKIKERMLKFPPHIQADIVELGYVPEEELSQWMRHADCFVFVSFFEGFGIPVIEAMASNVPVVCSNTTSLPEVASGAAILVDPKSPLDISAALSKIIHSQKVRGNLIYKGRKRALNFTWEKAAKATLEILKEASRE
ncbi:glycosyltransferase family 4 protein [Candidatus Berkelbacteria bacterium]|nr:glycosyltransferase family 4 protein [Candidatus Berkelbacteria bacterium]